MSKRVYERYSLDELERLFEAEHASLTAALLDAENRRLAHWSDAVEHEINIVYACLEQLSWVIKRITVGKP